MESQAGTYNVDRAAMTFTGQLMLICGWQDGRELSWAFRAKELREYLKTSGKKISELVITVGDNGEVEVN